MGHGRGGRRIAFTFLEYSLSFAFLPSSFEDFVCKIGGDNELVSAVVLILVTRVVGGDWGCARACIQYLRPYISVASLRGRFCFNVVILLWDSFFLHLHHQYTVHSHNLLPWCLCWGKYVSERGEILVSRFVFCDGMEGSYCELWRDIFCNGEIFYFTIFLSPAFSGLLGDSGTKKERGGGERGEGETDGSLPPSERLSALLQTNAFRSIPPL